MYRDKHKLIANLRENIEQIEATIEAVALLPDELPEGCSFSAIPNCLFIHLPFSWPTYAHVRHQIDRASDTDWIPQTCWEAVDGHRSTLLKHATSVVRLHVQMNPTQTGSNCRLVKTGTRTYDTFKAVCD